MPQRRFERFGLAERSAPKVRDDPAAAGGEIHGAADAARAEGTEGH